MKIECNGFFSYYTTVVVVVFFFISIYIYIYFFFFLYIYIFLFYLLFFIARAQKRVGNEQNCSLTERSCKIPTPNQLAKLSLANTQVLLLMILYTLKERLVDNLKLE